MRIAWSTAKKRLRAQGIRFSENGFGMVDCDCFGNTITVYPESENTGKEYTLWNAYALVRDALQSGGTLSNDETSALNYYMLQTLFKGLKSE